MSNAEQELEALAKAIADRVRVGRPASPNLRIIKTARALKSGEFPRDGHIRRVKDLQKLYGLGWLVRQETFHRRGLDSLDDGELCALLQTLERAAECCREGIPLEDVGLIKTTGG